MLSFGVGLTAFALVAVATALGAAEWNRARDAAEVERNWRETRVVSLADLGSTRTLEILPLVNWSASRGTVKLAKAVCVWDGTGEE